MNEVSDLLKQERIAEQLSAAALASGAEYQADVYARYGKAIKQKRIALESPQTSLPSDLKSFRASPYRAEASDFPKVSADLAVFLIIAGFVLGYVLGSAT